MQALILDCDGVIAETERDGHRVAFNQAFRARGLDIEWSVEHYGELLRTAGGKERMARFFEGHGWPVDSADRGELIDELHRSKTDLFLEIIDSGLLEPRPGVPRLVDEAIAAGLRLAVCSTSSTRAVQSVINAVLGAERSAHLPVFAGDAVPAKKPDPGIYSLAAERLGVVPAQCVVVEDTQIGLQAALAAGMRCIVTPGFYTQGEDCTGADLVVEELGDDPVRVTLADCQSLCG